MDPTIANTALTQATQITNPTQLIAFMFVVFAIIMVAMGILAYKIYRQNAIDTSKRAKSRDEIQKATTNLLNTVILNQGKTDKQLADVAACVKEVQETNLQISQQHADLRLTVENHIKDNTRHIT
jgi:heme/copper-type cytochrome/quinol oxidase subunit 3